MMMMMMHMAKDDESTRPIVFPMRVAMDSAARLAVTTTKRWTWTVTELAYSDFE